MSTPKRVSELTQIGTAADNDLLVITTADQSSPSGFSSRKVIVTDARNILARSNSEIKTAYENNPDTNAYTDAEKTKLASVETGATADQTDAEIKTAYENNTNTNAYTDAEKSKLAATESSHYLGLYSSEGDLTTAHPTANPGDYADVDLGAGNDVTRYIWDDDDSKWVSQAGTSTELTDAQVKTKYENNPDTNAYTDAEKSKLTGVATGAEVNVNSDWTASSGDALILNKPSDLTDLSAHSVEELQDVSDKGSGAIITSAERGKLAGVETGATADQTDAEIKTSYENNANTNAYTDAEKSKLAALTPFNETLITYVDVNGNDATAALGDPTKPFKTPQAAVDAIEAVTTTIIGMVYLGNGTFIGDVTVSGMITFQSRGSSVLAGGTLTSNGRVYLLGVVTYDMSLAGSGEIRYMIAAMLRQETAVTHTFTGDLRMSNGGYVYLTSDADLNVPLVMLEPGSIQGASHLLSTVAGTYYDVDQGKLVNLPVPSNDADAVNKAYVDSHTAVVTKLGEYSSTYPYVVDDMVNYNGIIYVCLADALAKQPDIEPTYWKTYSEYDGVAEIHQEMRKVTSAEITQGYLTPDLAIADPAEVRVYKASDGLRLVNSSVVGSTGAIPDFGVDGNDIQINDNGSASGLSGIFAVDDVLILDYTVLEQYIVSEPLVGTEEGDVLTDESGNSIVFE